MKKFLPIAIIIILIVGGIYYLLAHKNSSAPQNTEQSNSENKITKEAIMEDFATKISEISPTKAVLGGKWFVTRYWFIAGSDNNFYAEYEDGHIMGRVLIEAGKQDNKLNYRLIAYFEPGENDWVLKTGEDKFLGTPLELYEYSEELGQWIKKN